MLRKKSGKTPRERLARYVNEELNWQEKLEYCQRVGDMIDQWGRKLKLAEKIRKEMRSE